MKKQWMIALVGMLLVLGITLGFLISHSLTGKVTSESSSGGSISSSTDEKGFIGYCDADMCITLPTIVEKEGKKWMLGVYKTDQGVLQLGYKNQESEKVISVNEP